LKTKSDTNEIIEQDNTLCHLDSIILLEKDTKVEVF